MSARLVLSTLAALLLVVGSSLAQERRVIVLGFDGVDPEVCRELMARGELPNLSRLAEEGAFTPLATTNPAESPVSWASFTVGGNPGRTGIFDFLHRAPDSYVPDIALVRRAERGLLPGDGQRLLAAAALGALVGLLYLLLAYLPARAFSRRRWSHRWLTLPAALAALAAAVAAHELGNRWVPRSVPMAVNARSGTPFWEVVGAAGHTCSVTQVPVTFPAEAFPKGEILCGLGTPDLRATWGTWLAYGETAAWPEEFRDPVNELDRALFIDGVADSITGGKLYLLEPLQDAGGRRGFRTIIPGPRDLTAAREASTGLLPTRDAELTIDVEDGRARFGALGETVAAAPGEWTEWLPLRFRLNPLITVQGMVRFRVRSLDPFFAYASPVNFDPAAEPLFEAMAPPLSAPRDLARRLVEETGGRYETVGWAIATNPLKDEIIDEDEFLEDMNYSFERRWDIVRNRLERAEARLLVGVLLATDRVQHMFWRYRDPQHPLHDAEAPARHRDAVAAVYRRMDEMVGETMARFVGEEVDLFVISDHGFSPFRKGVHLNSWLIDEGFMVLKDPSLRERGRLADISIADPFANVDWSRTKAYALGLGKIYLNRRGREPQGIIETPEEAEATMRAIAERLEALQDPEHEGPVVREVYRSSEVYTGPRAHEAADLVIGFERGYRVSWDTAAGRAPPGILEANTNKWSGDHCSVDPRLVPGVLFTNRPLRVADPSIVDLARTVLASLGVAPPEEMEGRDILRR